MCATPLDADGNGHGGLLADWHHRWRAVLVDACKRHGVRGQAKAQLLRLPLVGFYPAMRVALDAMNGRWGPLAAAVLSRSGRVVPGWPHAVAGRLEVIQRRALDVLHGTPERVRVASLAVSFFLSHSAEEGADYRQILGIDIGTKTLSPAGADPLDAVAAFGSVALTGYAATYDGRRAADEAAQDGRRAADEAAPPTA